MIRTKEDRDELRKRYLFKQNNIEIIELDYKNQEHYLYKKIDTYNSWTNRRHIFNYRDKVVTEKVKKSKLGFYYSKKEITYKDHYTEKKVENSAPLYKTFIFYCSDHTYHIRYPYQYNYTTIGEDKRPYELIDKKGMKDHFVFDLLKELENLFCKFKDEKIDTQTNDPTKLKRDPLILHELKFLIYTDIFGFGDGPKYQTNNEKILSHGFDLKTSFRKDKE